MKQNENAVSPVIGVMLMIVVTIIIAAVVSAFASNSDLAKRTGPSANIESQIMYSTVTQPVWSYGSHVTYYQPAIDCNKYPSTYFCQRYTGGYASSFGGTCTASSCVFSGGDVDLELVEDPDEMGSAEYHQDGIIAGNLDGILFTHNGGDPIDLNNLEMTVRYYDLSSTVYSSDLKTQLQLIPQGATSDTGSTAEYKLDTRYFVKVNSTSSEDNIIRSGDQFMFIVDHGQTLTFQPTYWALSSLRSDGKKGASIGIDTHSGETEWWLTDSPSGNTLAHGMLKVPVT